ncbi:unnamed protein product [Hydatigera taeniaeformis]|uniref:VPS13_mid_rpt domain-containing protein n=1 Tax=Hydatigena taeniaeformis TaxID=6205 RepID=A0A0R3WSW4_HYDTA|nr:unnamed protein product [Hydatigera taeniaeformis]
MAEIVPELALRCSAWELSLGMPIHQAIEIFKRLEGIITNIDVWYSEKSPFDFDILLHLTNDGIKLHFDPKCQRLKLIEITDLSKISLRYLSQHVNAPSEAPTLATIISVFGSTKQFRTSMTASDFYSSSSCYVIAELWNILRYKTQIVPLQVVENIMAQVCS